MTFLRILRWKGGRGATLVLQERGHEIVLALHVKQNKVTRFVITFSARLVFPPWSRILQSVWRIRLLGERGEKIFGVRYIGNNREEPVYKRDLPFGTFQKIDCVLEYASKGVSCSGLLRNFFLPLFDVI